MAHGWPTRVTVTADDHTRPTASVPEGAQALAGPIPVRFSEPVNGITSSSVVVRGPLDSLDPFANGPVVPGTWTCRDASGAATDCEAGPVRTALFTPTQPLTASAYYAVTPNPEFSLAVTDLAGNPLLREALWVQAAP
jgi:hypothetical protein